MKLNLIDNRGEVPLYQIFRQLDISICKFLDVLERMEVKNAGKDEANDYIIDTDVIKPAITRLTGLKDEE